MEDWSGFTDEELKKLKRQTSRPDGGGLRQVRNGPTVRGPPPGRFRTPPRETNVRNTSARRPPNSQPQLTLDRQEMLAPPAEQPKSTTVKDASQSQEKKVKEVSPKQDENKKEEDVSKEAVKPDPPPEVKEVGEKEFVQKQLSSVEAFQMQQKLMEEQNKKKRQLLHSAISQRQEKAKTEAVRLTRIQRELGQLDHLLSVDVCIIRDRIEEASRDFLEAQKRYERAEKEFIESKMDLHAKSELKDSLTEHLYTIIHQNEVRKAKKLTELMEKLDMEEEGEVGEVMIELSTPPAMTPQALLLGELPHSRHGAQTGTQAGPITSPPTPTGSFPGATEGAPVTLASLACAASPPPASTTAQPATTTAQEATAAAQAAMTNGQLPQDTASKDASSSTHAPTSNDMARGESHTNASDGRDADKTSGISKTTTVPADGQAPSGARTSAGTAVAVDSKVDTTSKQSSSDAVS